MENKQASKMDRYATVTNTMILPSEYLFHRKMDLSKDKKINISIQILVVLVVALMIGLAKGLNFPMKSNWSTGLTILITVAMCVIYMALHELIHGIFFRLFSGVKATYLIRFPFLCTGSEVFLNRKSFIIVALAPVIILGILLIPMMLFLPQKFFLSIYIVQVLNFAGAAGDYFQVYAISKLQGKALIQDNGKETKVFLPE